MKSESRKLWALLAWILLPYTLFLGFRGLRMAGDEKVYVSQIWEMHQAGTWFQQRLFDGPNFYKGPLHYLFGRLGVLIFGLNPWAVLYMNLLMIAVACGALWKVLEPLDTPKIDSSPGDQFSGGISVRTWACLGLGLGIGVYAHAYTSQMEIELVGLYTLGVYFLSRLSQTQASTSSPPIGFTPSALYAFWTCAGLIGWIKSPLHSVLLGVSGLLYWGLAGELLKLARSKHFWLSGALGVIVGAAGYLPGYLSAPYIFYTSYLLRELYFKSAGSGQPASVALYSTFGFYLFPLILGALAGYLYLFRHIKGIYSSPPRRRLLLLAASAFLPSVLFFYYHPYHFENYNLPVIAGVWILLALGLEQVPDRWQLNLHRFTGIIPLMLLFGLICLTTHFGALPSWWPAWVNWALPVLLLSSAIALFSRKLAPGISLLLTAVGLASVVLGERELVDLRRVLQSPSGPSPIHSVRDIGYVNLQRNIWSEWGYLQFWIGRPIQDLHTPELLEAAVRSEKLILVAAKETEQADFTAAIANLRDQFNFEIIPWKRWRTRGTDSSGQPLWSSAWNRRDLSLLETEYWIVRITKK